MRGVKRDSVRDLADRLDRSRDAIRALRVEIGDLRLKIHQREEAIRVEQTYQATLERRYEEAKLG